MNKMIPSEIIRADENGNLEIDGAIKLSGGLDPVFTDKFELQDNTTTYKCTFIDYGEIKGTYFHILYFDFDDGGSQTLGFGTYDLDNYGVSKFNIYGISVVDNEFQIVSLPNTNIGTVPTYTSVK